jgi:hypothetical protein
MDQPTTTGWGAAPPPARRRPGPGLLAAAMALLLVFGAIGLVAMRAAGSNAGGRSPESAATGLLAALDKRDLERAGDFLQGEERQLAAAYRDRLTRLIAEGRGTNGPLAGLDLTARDLRFNRAAGSSDGSVVVLEAVDGTVGVRGPNGVQVQLPVAEARRQLATRTHGAVDSLRLVTVRGTDGRWYVSLLASSAEWGRLAGKAGDADYGLLTGGAAGAAGSASPEEAVRELLASASDGDPAKVADRLAPDEARVADAYRQPLLDRLGLGKPGSPLGPDRPVHFRIDGLTTRNEQVADGVVTVHLTGGTVRVTGKPPVRISEAMTEHAALVTVRQQGGWYPSLLGTAVNNAIAEAQRAHP